MPGDYRSEKSWQPWFVDRVLSSRVQKPYPCGIIVTDEGEVPASPENMRKYILRGR